MLIDRTSEPLMQLLVDSTRRAGTAGPALAQAHRAVGRALASDIARALTIEPVEIDHVAGKSQGVRLQPGLEPIIIAILRAGLFLAEGIWDSIPGSVLVLHRNAGDSDHLPAAGHPVVLVDSVINTGASMMSLIHDVTKLRPARVLVAVLVGYRPALEGLSGALPNVDFVVGRVSDRTYVGQGPTDTGARLFGTTSWATEKKR